MAQPLVSVIVPTKNSEEYLAVALHDIVNQDYKPIELIVVDNYSTDDTMNIAKIYADAIYQVGPERATQDNYGIQKAHGSIIWLTGSDMRSDPTDIKQGVEKIKEGYDAIYASVLTDRYVKHYWGRVKKLERKCYIGDDTIESARFFKKSVWEELGGFDERLVQVEEDFQHRLDHGGYRTGRIAAREYHMHEDRSLKTIFAKSRYYGKFMSYYVRKHHLRGVKQLFPARSAFFRNWRLFARNPELVAGLIVYKLVQYTGGLYGAKR
jgi:glycosyltransferase involved in cell wall biosynthesis